MPEPPDERPCAETRPFAQSRRASASGLRSRALEWIGETPGRFSERFWGQEQRGVQSGRRYMETGYGRSADAFSPVSRESGRRCGRRVAQKRGSPEGIDRAKFQRKSYAGRRARQGVHGDVYDLVC